MKPDFSNDDEKAVWRNTTAVNQKIIGVCVTLVWNRILDKWEL